MNSTAKLIQTADGYKYRGYQIRKTFKHGFTYWRINKEQETCSTRTDAIKVIDSRVELFERTLTENKIYCELVETDSPEQIEQLEVCNKLLKEIASRGLLIEYGEYLEEVVQ